MKYLTLSLALVLSLLGLGYAPTPHAEAATDQRDVIFFWEEKGLRLIGHHRPYSSIEIRENDEKLGEVSVDAAGVFETLLMLDRGEEHLLTFHAYDHYGREIKKANGDPDTLTKKILPGLSLHGSIRGEEGQSVAGATVRAYDADGNLLNKTTTDELGNYTFGNLPEGAVIKVEGEDFDGEEFVFDGKVDVETNVNAAGSGRDGPTIDFTENPDEQKNAGDKGPTEESDFPLWILIVGGILLVGVLVIGVLFLLKKKS